MTDSALSSPPAGVSGGQAAAPGALPSAGQQVESQEALTKPGEAAPAPVAKPAAKPIPPAVEARQKAKSARPTLPGLVDDRDHDVLDDVLLPRDPTTGRFKSREEAEAEAERELVGEPESQAPRKPAAAPPLPGGAKPVTAGAKKFADEYETVEALEQAHKSLRGQYKSFEQNRSKLVEEKEHGYRSGWAWKSEYEKAQERIAALEQEIVRRGGGNQAGGASPQAGSPQGTSQSASATNAATGGVPSVDDLLAGDVGTQFEALAVRSGLPDAGKFLVQSTLNAVLNKVVPALREEMRKELQPFQQDRQGQQAEAEVANTIQSVMSLRNPAGGEAFPELKDPATIHAIGRMWVEAGHREEEAFTNSGLISAIALYRLMTSFNPPAKSAATVPPTVAARPAAAAGPSASLDAGGEHTLPPNNGRQDESLTPEARRLVAALSMNEPMIDKTLGFARNKRS